MACLRRIVFILAVSFTGSFFGFSRGHAEIANSRCLNSVSLDLISEVDGLFTPPWTVCDFNDERQTVVRLGKGFQTGLISSADAFGRLRFVARSFQHCLSMPPIFEDRGNYGAFATVIDLREDLLSNNYERYAIEGIEIRQTGPSVTVKIRAAVTPEMVETTGIDFAIMLDLMGIAEISTTKNTVLSEALQICESPSCIRERIISSSICEARL